MLEPHELSRSVDFASESHVVSQKAVRISGAPGRIITWVTKKRGRRALADSIAAPVTPGDASQALKVASPADSDISHSHPRRRGVRPIPSHRCLDAGTQWDGGLPTRRPQNRHIEQFAWRSVRLLWVPARFARVTHRHRNHLGDLGDGVVGAGTHVDVIWPVEVLQQE